MKLYKDCRVSQKELSRSGGIIEASVQPDDVDGFLGCH